MPIWKAFKENKNGVSFFGIFSCFRDIRNPCSVCRTCLFSFVLFFLSWLANIFMLTPKFSQNNFQNEAESWVSLSESEWTKFGSVLTVVSYMLYCLILADLFVFRGGFKLAFRLVRLFLTVGMKGGVGLIPLKWDFS